MSRCTLRTRLALSMAALVFGVLVLFGALSAWELYREQVHAYDETVGHKMTRGGAEAEAKDVVGDLLTAFIIALPFAAAMAAGAGYWIVRAALRPLEEMANAAERISGQSLSLRVPEVFCSDEVGRLARVLNATFDRLERNFRQATRFTADASHELRTPLTILRGEIESALDQENCTEEQQATLESLLAQTQNLGDIIAKLLLLARADAGQLSLALTRLDLSAFCLDLAEDAEVLAAPRDIAVQADIVPGISVDADESLLRQVMLNLVENAVKYNTSGGRIRIALSVAARVAKISVENTGLGIPVDLAGRVFERFFRVDHSRARDTGGTGLGLSICHEIMAAHHGAIALRQTKPGWVAFEIELPGAGLATYSDERRAVLAGAAAPVEGGRPR